jgi:hypothetical protein
MDFINYRQQPMIRQLPDIIRAYEGDRSAHTLSEMESAVKQMLHELGKVILHQWLEAQEPKYADDYRSCPHCEGQVAYVRRREGMSITLQGRIHYRRAYYLCRACHHGFYPLDERLGIEAGEMSAEVMKLAALFGVAEAFDSSSDLLARGTCLELSPNSIRKATQQAGARVVADEQRLQQRSQALEAQQEQRRTVNKPHRLYGSMAGVMVLLEDGYHEMKAGAWWTTTTTRQGDLKPHDIHYY